jgi:predicted GH43/DUF377 family glycosyl hydrolase
MRRRLILGLAFLALAGALSAQTDWAKSDTNPVLIRWGLNEFYAIGQPTVIMERDSFKMWYAACGVDNVGRIFYAWSVNGVNWTRYFLGLPVLNVGAAGTWDSKWLDTPEILRDADEYKLFYFGDSARVTPAMTAGFGLAHSQNGINWVKDSAANPVFRRGPDTAWDGHWIESPAVIVHNDTYLMYYSGIHYEVDDFRGRIGLAISTDARNWMRYEGNPVIDLGPAGSFDDQYAATPAVIWRNGQYEMWYSGLSYNDLRDTHFDTVRIGYATSADGRHWQKYAGNPVLSTFSPPYRPHTDSSGPWAPDVVFDGAGYRMWYETKAGFCYATSSLTGMAESRMVRFPSAVQVQPNPSSGRVCITAPGLSGAIIYDRAGRVVMRLRGRGEVVWDGRDAFGNPVGAGVYYCRARRADATEQLLGLVRCP